MRRITNYLLAASVALLMAGAAAADTGNPSISSLPEKGPVTVSGTVSQMQNEHDFTLTDHTGSIHVRISSNVPMVIKKGDSVTVSGQVEKPFWGLMGKDIKATKVEIHKDLSSMLSDAITNATGVTVDKADNVSIGKLPAQGMVQISGTVDKVSDPKHFTVKDPTGSIDVNVLSNENVVLSKGAEVTVTGYVGHTMFSRQINATHVMLVSSAPADNGPSNTNIN